MLASPFVLDSQVASSVAGQIWSDQLARIVADRKRLLAAVPELKLHMSTETFTATLKAPDRTYIVSAVNDGCSSSALVPNELICHARLAEQTPSGVKVIADDPEFPIALRRGDAGYDASSNTQQMDKTVVSYDREKDQFYYTVYHNGRSFGPVNTFLARR
jgi:hypothetical protein